LPQVEVAVGLGIERARRQRDVETAEPASLAGEHRQSEALAQPAGEPDVVGVVVGDDQAREAAAGEGAGRERVPHRTGCVVADPGIENGPAIAVVDQIDVDVVEAERQGNARPQDARCDLDDGAGLRRFGHRKHQLCIVGLAHMRSGAPGTIRLVPGILAWIFVRCTGGGAKVPRAGRGLAQGAGLSQLALVTVSAGTTCSIWEARAALRCS
jgi:hypothetical protein